MSGPKVDAEENRRRMKAGEFYFAFTPDLTAARKRCKMIQNLYNKADDLTRREQVEIYQKLVCDTKPLPQMHVSHSEEEDEAQFEDYPILDSPVKMDYGWNVRLGSNVYINANSTWIDTCEISVGARTLVGPNCSFFSGTHPLDPSVRNGTRGPEAGKPIHIGSDCWLGGNVIVLPGVNIGNGATVGAGSVVTKDVPPFTVVVGNPARVIRTIGVSGQVDPAEALAGEDTVLVRASSST